VAEALGLIGDPAAAQALARRITMRNAAIALRRIGSRAIPAVVERMDDPDENVRKACAWILAKIGDARAIPPLASRLAHGGYVLKSLEALDWTPERPEEKIVAMLMHGELDGVTSLGEEAAPHLVEAFQSDDPQVRTAAHQVVVRLGSSALPVLIPALK